MLKQLPCTRKGREGGQVTRHKNLFPLLTDLLPHLTILCYTNRLRQQLVASLTDQRTDLLKRDVIAILAHGFYPGVGMGVVAVYQCAVNIENCASYLCQQRVLPTRKSFPYRN